MREVPLAHPGQILATEWLEPHGLSQSALAKAIAVPPRRINKIVQGKRPITPDMALRLAAFFGTDAQSWLNLQVHYDLESVREKIASDLHEIKPYRYGVLPHDVVRRLVNGATPVRAWRKHLQLTQAHMAERLDIKQSDYAQLETMETIRGSCRKKIAKAMGIDAALLDV